MDVEIRWAKLKDVSAIYRIGITHRAFRVSNRTKFYSRAELEEWAQNKRGDIFLVADKGGEIAGFIFIRLMARDWALLDNFFVLPKYRRHRIGRQLFYASLKKLKNRKVSYISSLVRPTHNNFKYSKEIGFRPAKEYVWIERSL